MPDEENHGPIDDHADDPEASVETSARPVSPSRTMYSVTGPSPVRKCASKANTPVSTVEVFRSRHRADSILPEHDNAEEPQGIPRRRRLNGPAISAASGYEAWWQSQRRTPQPATRPARSSVASSGARTSRMPVVNFPNRNTHSPKSLSRGDQHALALVRLPKHFLVRDAGRQFGDVDHFVLLGPEPLHDRAVDTLVATEVHAATGDG